MPTATAGDDGRGQRGDGWRLDGEKRSCRRPTGRPPILVPARTGEGGTGVFLVGPTAPGVSLERETAVTGEPQWTVRLHGVVIDGDALVGDSQQGDEIVEWITDRLAAAICATQIGVCEEALAITARYVSEREQFGASSARSRPSPSAWPTPTSTPRPFASPPCRPSGACRRASTPTTSCMTAKFWAADGGQRVVHAAQHLHGGIGVDVDYPIHRYFRWAKVLELTLGGASPSLLRLGASLAAQPVGGA